MTRGWQIFLIAATAIIIPGGIWAGMGIAALTKICYNVIKYEITKFNFTNMELSFTLKVKNPSNIKVIIEGYNINIELNGVNVGQIVSKSKKTLKSEQHSTIVIPVNIKIDKKTLGNSKIREVFDYFITKQYEKIFVSLSGHFNGRLLKIPIPVKIDLKYTLAEIINIMDSPDESEKC